MNTKSLPGLIKAASLIQAMDDRTAAEILAMLSDGERQVLQNVMAQSREISAGIQEKVATDFLALMTPQLVGAASPLPQDPHGFSPSPDSPALGVLQSKDPDELVALIKDEHPQTIAVILVHLFPDKASEILSLLPDEIKTDVAFRIASSGKFAAEMVDEMNAVFEDILRRKHASGSVEAGGVKRLADILNLIDKASADRIMSEIQKEDPALFAQIKQMMFVIDDIALVDDRGLQNVLRRVESKDLAVALKAATQEIRDKIFRNMSSRAGEMLREEMDSLGAVRMKEVEEAQQIILNIIQEMEAEGKLIIRRGGGDEFVE
ncbi:flagellar motor switch protein FliG [Desulfococcus sp.]|uniref:flagellar motor switch protein FliG n=1 Tax=Desulfococcus sp. TaxID=2025834 RepID=UPI003592EA06